MISCYLNSFETLACHCVTQRRAARPMGIEYKEPSNEISGTDTMRSRVDGLYGRWKNNNPVNQGSQQLRPSGRHGSRLHARQQPALRAANPTPLLGRTAHWARPTTFRNTNISSDSAVAGAGVLRSRTGASASVAQDHFNKDHTHGHSRR